MLRNSLALAEVNILICSRQTTMIIQHQHWTRLGAIWIDFVESSSERNSIPEPCTRSHYIIYYKPSTKTRNWLISPRNRLGPRLRPNIFPKHLHVSAHYVHAIASAIFSHTRPLTYIYTYREKARIQIAHTRNEPRAYRLCAKKKTRPLSPCCMRPFHFPSRHWVITYQDVWLSNKRDRTPVVPARRYKMLYDQRIFPCAPSFASYIMIHLTRCCIWIIKSHSIRFHHAMLIISRVRSSGRRKIIKKKRHRASQVKCVRPF